MNNTEECIVTKHAIERFLERRKDPNPPKDPKKTIIKLFNKATEIRFHPRFQFYRLLNNGVKEATYYNYDNWIFVCSNNIIVTMEKTNGKKLGIDFFKTERAIQSEKEKALSKEIERLKYYEARDKLFGKDFA